MIVYHQSNRDRSVMKLEPKRVSNLSRISPFSFFLDSFHQMRITHVKLLSGSSSFSDEFFFFFVLKIKIQPILMKVQICFICSSKPSFFHLVFLFDSLLPPMYMTWNSSIHFFFLYLSMCQWWSKALLLISVLWTCSIKRYIYTSWYVYPLEIITFASFVRIVRCGVSMTWFYDDHESQRSKKKKKKTWMHRLVHLKAFQVVIRSTVPRYRH